MQVVKSHVAVSVLGAGCYAFWYVWSRHWARYAGVLLKPAQGLTALILRALGPLFGVHYRVIFDKSHKVTGQMGWPYYNEQATVPQSLICWHPHSALTIMPFTFLQPSFVFGRDVFIGVASALFRIPIIREILMIGNCRIVEGKVMNALAESGKSIMVQPGGVYEQLHFADDHEVAYFHANLGFLRLAVRHGLPVIPSYVFGENQLYKSRPDRKRISALLSKLGLPTPAASGRLGLPAGVCLPGKPVLVVGEAISPPRKGVDKSGSPCLSWCLSSEEETAVVGRLFRVYLRSLRAIWREHCHHLPEAVASKGLRCIYRKKCGGEILSVASDDDKGDDELVEAFLSAHAPAWVGA